MSMTVYVYELSYSYIHSIDGDGVRFNLLFCSNASFDVHLSQFNFMRTTFMLLGEIIKLASIYVIRIANAI